MTEKVQSIQGAIHFEPLTELAVQRYNLNIDRDDFRFEQIDPDSVKDLDFLLELMSFYSEPNEDNLEQFEVYSLSVILDYLRKTHEFYIEQLLPKIEMSITAMTSLFPDTHSAILLKYFYNTYRNELLEHIDMEETKLFPYAEQLYDGVVESNYSVAAFQRQHDHHIVDQLDEIIQVIDDGNDEIARSFAYRTFKHLIEQFRNDLHVHHLIEEKVLLHRLIELERFV